MIQTKKITWLIAHEPVQLFLRTAEAFRDKIAELTDNKFEVEIYTLTEYETKFPPCSKKIRDSSQHFIADSMSLLDSNEIQMSQMHITEIARWHSPEFLALEMPFIFEDHDHATRVLEGPIGRKMLDELAEKSPARGMEFTYSGGFRCLASNVPINGLNDMQNIDWATTYNPVTVDTVEAIGAIPKSLSLAEFISCKPDGIDSAALETTIPRYLAQFQNTIKRYLLNTKHNLFLTSIIIGNKFWATLSDSEKNHFKEACIYASRLERKWSVEEAEAFAAKKDHSNIGVTYAELSAEDTEKFKQAVAPLYNKYRDFFYPGLIDGIIKS
jgi:TRAP-type C4-dicarboxylate transport system substrate-binding protein